jgi:hypothetical protein
LERRKDGAGDGDRDRNDEKGGGEEPPGPTSIESAEGDPAFFGELPAEMVGDQEPRDHKKDINSDIATGDG